MSATRNADGAGLGLCIVKEVVEAHGGRVDLESSTTAPSGTTVTCYLPMKQTYLGPQAWRMPLAAYALPGTGLACAASCAQAAAVATGDRYRPMPQLCAARY
eukprot:1385247-Rhodomonas_salina.2